MLIKHNTHQRGKSESRELIVTFPNGCSLSSYQNCEDATEVWVKTIEELLAEFGVNRILEADRLARRSHSKERIISTDPTFRDTKTREKRSTEYRENGVTYFIIHDYNAPQKKQILESISDVLNAGLIVNSP